MKRYFLTAVVACVASSLLSLSGSSVLGQGFLEQLGRELIQRELQPQQNQRQQPARPSPPQGDMQFQSMGMPSESGRDSGGGRFTGPGNGDFALPGQTQPIQPGFGNPSPIVQPGQQVFPGGQPGGTFIQPGNQLVQPGRNVWPGGQPNDLSRPIYIEGQNHFHETQRQQGTIISQPTETRYIANDLPGNPVSTSQVIVIRCPASTVGSISYLLSSNRGRFRFTMTAGQEQRFGAGTNWTIGYNDGSVERRYELHGGKTYTMKRKSDNRWQVYASSSAGT